MYHIANHIFLGNVFKIFNFTILIYFMEVGWAKNKPTLILASFNQKFSSPTLT
jgi:hypothetical protein